MNVNEVAHALGWRREDVLDALNKGVATPVSKTVVVLTHDVIGKDPDVSEAQLDAFVALFEIEEPGRHPPTETRRALLVESGHKCGVCRSDGPLEYHHIIEWSKLKHHDPRHMLAVCGTCHAKIGNGTIDPKAQRQYKQKLQGTASGTGLAGSDGGPIRFFWKDIADIIQAVHKSGIGTSPDADSRYDLSSVSLDVKNQLNQLGSGYFEEMKDSHEPHFHKIEEFLRAPENADAREQYHGIVDDIRMQLAVHRQSYAAFEDVLRHLYEATVAASPDGFRTQRRTVNVFFSFMYFNCDIGKKS